MCQERDPESGLVLVRGSPNWTNISPASIYGSGSAYQGCEYNDFVYPFGDCIPNKQMLVMTLDESLRNADHDDLEYGRQGDTYRMRLLRGLTDGDEPTGPDNGRGDLAGVDQSGLFEWTLYSWNDIYNAGLVYGVDGFKFYRHGKVYYMMNSGGRFNSLPAGFRALTGMSGTGTLIMNTDDLAFLGQLPFEEQMTYDASIVIKNRRGVGGVDQINYSDRYWYLLTVTVNGRTVGSPQKIATLSNGETEWTDETVILNTSIVNIYRGTAKINTAALPAPASKE
ncbi:hypothetical protein SPFM20_00127 [Salmonella phage SPFM20]|nr:hypothetical protein SPFM20_00127 [Salmonella phage SPFM20]